MRRSSLRETGGQDGWSPSTESGLQVCYGKTLHLQGFPIQGGTAVHHRCITLFGIEHISEGLTHEASTEKRLVELNPGGRLRRARFLRKTFA